MTRVIDYVDPVAGYTGHLVYDLDQCRLAVGGCRAQPAVTAGMLAELASRMTLKQRVLGVGADGAKCGIALDPHAPDSAAAIARFVAFLRDELQHRFSMGCDMGTRFDALELAAQAAGVSSIKYAVKQAQRLTEDEFQSRILVLDQQVGLRTVSQRRAGHALAHSAIAVGRFLGLPVRGLHCGLQGFGNLGRSAAESLIDAGALVTAVADEGGCATHPRGLDIGRMLSLPPQRPVLSMLATPLRLPSQALFDLPVDVLILAAGEDALTAEQAAVLPAQAVVVGANCGLSPTVERLLVDRGVLVVPDFIGGIGGSASMEALFGPPETPSPAAVLDTVAQLIHELLGDVLSGARDRGVSPATIGQDIAAAAVVDPDRPPYGFSPYVRRSRTPQGNRAAVARPIIKPQGER